MIGFIGSCFFIIGTLVLVGAIGGPIAAIGVLLIWVGLIAVY